LQIAAGPETRTAPLAGVAAVRDAAGQHLPVTRVSVARGGQRSPRRNLR
jgi:hypothetical protein